MGQGEGLHFGGPEIGGGVARDARLFKGDGGVGDVPVRGGCGEKVSLHGAEDPLHFGIGKRKKASKDGGRMEILGNFGDEGGTCGGRPCSDHTEDASQHAAGGIVLPW